MRKSKSLSWIRPFLPVILGLSLGFSMSLVRIPLNQDGCQNFLKDHIDRQLRSVDSDFNQINRGDGLKTMDKDGAPAEPIYDSFEDFEPRIITDPGLKPRIDLSANKKKVVRTRFISTELGIREKLYVGVLTSTDKLQSLGVAFNKTAAHILQKVEFYVAAVSDMENQSKNPKYMVTKMLKGDTMVHRLYEMISNMLEENKDTYDWFFIVKDNVYVQGERLDNLVSHISINRILYMGMPHVTNIDSQSISYCSMDNGILLSRLLLVTLLPNLQKCANEGSMSDPSVWLGNCIHQTFDGRIKCSTEQDGQNFFSYTISEKMFDPERVGGTSFRESLTVGNVETPPMFYKLHRQISQFEIELASKEIEAIQREIEFINTKLPDSDKQTSWPIGINPPFKPTNRWDIIVWDYFTEEYTLTCPGEVPKCELSGIDKLDVQNILQIAMERLNDKYNPQKIVLEKKKLLNGYRRFDPQRGMEYTLDLLLNAMVEGEKGEIEINHRVHLLRPLSQVEIIPMPYVTEATRIRMILPITADQKSNFDAFIQRFASAYLDADENIELSVVFIYDPSDAQRIHDDDVFGDVKQKLQEYETKYHKKKPAGNAKLIPWVSIKTEVPSQLKTMDVVAKKHPMDALFFLTSVNVVLDTEFLNRCRMNAVQGWQTFFPVPFAQYNTDIVFKDKPIPKDIEIKPSYGHFDLYSFDEVCFYNSDYMAARNKLSEFISDSDNNAGKDPMDTLDIYKLLVKYSELHVFRAVEPQLKRHYSHRQCNSRSGEDLYQKCERSNAESLASRTQLAMELFPDENEKKL
ncbi:chondroitin sulfate synthase 2-like [Styela clava]